MEFLRLRKVNATLNFRVCSNFFNIFHINFTRIDFLLLNQFTFLEKDDWDSLRLMNPHIKYTGITSG